VAEKAERIEYLRGKNCDLKRELEEKEMKTRQLKEKLKTMTL